MGKSLRERVTDHLVEAMGLAEADVEELMALAQTLAVEALAAIQTQVAAEDLAALSETAHSLKGNFLNMGLDELAALAKDMEAGAKAGDMERVARAAGGLKDALEQF
jgi:HPt (histidine-containing phosphotransfer) domain-containing protein